MPSISWEKAQAVARGSSKFSHSVLVSRIMRVLARHLGENEEEWAVVGLLHDIDYDLVQGDMSRHGVMASKILEGRLSEESLHAIMAHDHRTGVKPETLLDESLVFADSLGILMAAEEIDLPDGQSRLEEMLRRDRVKPWIRKNIISYSGLERVSITQIITAISCSQWDPSK